MERHKEPELLPAPFDRPAHSRLLVHLRKWRRPHRHPLYKHHCCRQLHRHPHVQGSHRHSHRYQLADTQPRGARSGACGVQCARCASALSDAL